MKSETHINILRLLGLAAFLALTQPSSLCAAEHLDTGEIAAIGASSVVTGFIGWRMASFDSTKKSLWVKPLPGEMAIGQFLGGRYHPGKSNFLNGRLGELATPIVSLAGLAALNLAFEKSTAEKDALQDVFLFSTGFAASAGLTGLFKGILARPRPYVILDSLSRYRAARGSFRYDHQSFFSGHASAAFYSVTYLNKRVRAIMRQELTGSDYDRIKWLSPTILYAWAAFVAWSRIEAYQHYLSDVTIGALAGCLVAELFFSFNDNLPDATDRQEGAPILFRVTFSF